MNKIKRSDKINGGGGILFWCKTLFCLICPWTGTQSSQQGNMNRKHQACINKTPEQPSAMWVGEGGRRGGGSNTASSVFNIITARSLVWAMQTDRLEDSPPPLHPPPTTPLQSSSPRGDVTAGCWRSQSKEQQPTPTPVQGCLTHFQTADTASQLKRPAASQVVIFFYISVNWLRLCFKQISYLTCCQIPPEFDATLAVFLPSRPQEVKLMYWHRQGWKVLHNEWSHVKGKGQLRAQADI